MKKEIFTAALFVLLLAAAVFNVHHLREMTDGLSSLVGEAYHDAEAGQWESAEAKAEAALARWDAADVYTHIFVRHSETDSVSEAFYEFLGEIYKRDAAGAHAECLALAARLDSIYSMERIRFGTVL